MSAELAWVVMTTSFSFSVGEFSVMGVTSGEGEWTKTLGFSRIEVPAEDAERESKHLLSSFVAEWPGLSISIICCGTIIALIAKRPCKALIIKRRTRSCRDSKVL